MQTKEIQRELEKKFGRAFSKEETEALLKSDFQEKPDDLVDWETEQLMLAELT